MARNKILTLILTALFTILPSTALRCIAQDTQVYADHSKLASGKWAKVRVSDNGIVRLTPDIIRQAGFNDISKVKVYGYGGAMIPETLTQDYLRETDDLQEVATCSYGDCKYFYANGPVSWKANSGVQRVRNPYSSYGYYFITQSDAAALSCTEQELLTLANSNSSHFFNLYEEDKFAWTETGRNLFDGNEIKEGKSHTFNVKVSGVPSSVTVVVTSGKAAEYTITAGSNTRSGTLSFVEYDVAKSITYTFTPTDFANVATQQPDGSYIYPVTVTCRVGGPLRLDYIQATVPDVADVPALASGNYPAVEFVSTVANQDHHADDVVDNIIIIPTSQKLRAQAMELGELHLQQDGMTYRIIPANELYNEFSSGTPDLSAYRRYLKMFFDKANGDLTQTPKHVILFGDALWDQRCMTLSSSKYSPDDYLLVYETEDTYSTLRSFCTDDFITILKDGKTLHSSMSSDRTLTFDIAVGRIPVTTDSDARKVINKIKQYTSPSNAGSWRNEIMFIGDDGDANSHMKNIDINADSVIKRNAGYIVKKAYVDSYKKESTSLGTRSDELSSLIKKQQNDGALVMNYGGHASWLELADEHLLTLSDFADFRGKNYSLWVTAACETVPFDGTYATIGETALLNANGGAIAFYGTSRTVTESANSRLNISFMRNVLSRDTVEVDGIYTLRPITLGEAQRRTKNALVSSLYPLEYDRTINKHNYVLIGDPALSLALPRYTAVIDSISSETTSNTVVVSGNDIVSVKGHIQDAMAQTISTFNGKAQIEIKDSEQKVTTLDHAGQGAYNYQYRNSKLFNGTCSIKDGEFNIVFRVPRDIYNDGKNALITVYALDDNTSHAANGESQSLSVQGWSEAKNDSVGPSIYCYLNSESFQNGDAVGRTPFFVAQITDLDGINTTGSGIGHNLELVIDDMPTRTYYLNDKFLFDYGSYTSGQTYFVLPELEVGNHTLTFKAWDLLNNSNSVTLDFRVVKALAPNIYDVRVSPNPVRGEATFYVTHDMRGSNASIVLEIFNTSGSMVQTNEWTDILSDKTDTSAYSWSSTGIKPGIYLYRIRVACDGSSYVSKTKKLIIAQ